MDRLLASGDIATLAGVTRNTVRKWAQRHPSFRALAQETSAGLVWHESDVLVWLQATGRRPEHELGDYAGVAICATGKEQ